VMKFARPLMPIVLASTCISKELQYLKFKKLINLSFLVSFLEIQRVFQG